MRCDAFVEIRQKFLSPRRAWREESLSELVDLSGTFRCSGPAVDSRVGIRRAALDECPDGYEPNLLVSEDLLVFSVEVSESAFADYTELYWRKRTRDPIAQARHEVGTELNWAVEVILLAVHLAKPGGLLAFGGVTGCEGQFTPNHIEVQPFSLANAVDSSEAVGWPHLFSLPISDTYEWLLRLPGFPEKGQGAVGRALAAFKQIVFNRHQTNVVDLLWAMVGLEALYGRDQEPVGSQLLKKAGLWLGQRDGYEKRMRKAYQDRSKFLHGEVDLPIFDSDVSEKFNESFDKKFGDSTDLALTVLAASLQELVRRNRHALEFVYKLVDAP